MADKWAEKFNKMKTRVAHAPKNAVNSVKNSFNDKINTTKTGINRKIKPFKDFANAKGFSGKAKFLGKSALNYAKGLEAYAKIQSLILKMQNAIMFIAAHIYPILITLVILLVGIPLSIFLISMAQGVSATPHYYCDTEADSSLKRTAVYQQYCNYGNSFALENLNGHYVVQDGSGPCTDCATLNMMLRFFALHDINLYDYMWQDDGMYTTEGQTFGTGTGSNKTVRGVINGYTSSVTSCTARVGTPNGSIDFAQKHGRGGTYDMANWGYFRDDSLDLAVWDQTSDYYESNASSDKWVWDLSLPSKGVGTSWSAVWEHDFIVNEVTYFQVTETGSTVTGDRIKRLLADPAVCGEAGILVYYNYGSGSHAVLITGYDDSTGYWRIIDSAKGLAGGYEGPIDGSGNFAIYEDGLSTLLNTGPHGSFSINNICYIMSS